MLRPVLGESRKFEVIGYGDFERICEEGDSYQKRWIGRLFDIFDDVDFSIEDRFDARPRQLRTILSATADLVLALHKAQGEQTIIPPASIDTAEEVLSKVGSSTANSMSRTSP